VLPLLRGREWCARRAGDWPMLQHMPSAESRDGTNWCAYLRRKMDKAVPGRGFLLNNELTDFSFDEATGAGAGFANRPEGGKKRRASALGASDALSVLFPPSYLHAKPQYGLF
jgi:hypothetical protein